MNYGVWSMQTENVYISEQQEKRWFFQPIAIRLVLASYCFLLLAITEYLNITRNGFYNFIKEHYIILIICLVLIEILNQITFYLSPKKHEVAVWLRAFLFWLIFSVSIAIYILFLLRLEKDIVFKWYVEVFRFLLYLILSLILAHYSLVPEFQFLILRGRYRKS